MSILRQQLGVFGDPVMYPKTAKDLPSSQSSSIDEVIEETVADNDIVKEIEVVKKEPGVRFSGQKLTMIRRVSNNPGGGETDGGREAALSRAVGRARRTLRK